MGTIFQDGVNEVDLSSFKIHDGLSGKIWDKDATLKRDVRLELLDIADNFINEIGFDLEVEDIVLCGSICNYNWSYESDIDLHILVDYKGLDDNIELVTAFFKTKKQEWCESHDIRIKGFDVEVYVQDTSEEPKSGGVYSLNTDKWLKKPTKDDFSNFDYDNKQVSDVCDEVIDFVQVLQDRFERCDGDKYVSRKVNDYTQRLIDTLITLRRKGLAKNGESSLCNLAYKALRRNSAIDKLFDLNAKSYDAIHSID